LNGGQVQLMMLMGGLLPDTERQVFAVAIYQTTNAMCFMLSLRISTTLFTG
jgi:hypothetical protein